MGLGDLDRFLAQPRRGGLAALESFLEATAAPPPSPAPAAIAPPPVPPTTMPVSGFEGFAGGEVPLGIAALPEPLARYVRPYGQVATRFPEAVQEAGTAFFESLAGAVEPYPGPLRFRPTSLPALARAVMAPVAYPYHLLSAGLRPVTAPPGEAAGRAIAPTLAPIRQRLQGETPEEAQAAVEAAIGMGFEEAPGFLLPAAAAIRAAPPPGRARIPAGVRPVTQAEQPVVELPRAVQPLQSPPEAARPEVLPPMPRRLPAAVEEVAPAARPSAPEGQVAILRERLSEARAAEAEALRGLRQLEERIPPSGLREPPAGEALVSQVPPAVRADVESAAAGVPRGTPQRVVTPARAITQEQPPRLPQEPRLPAAEAPSPPPPVEAAPPARPPAEAPVSAPPPARAAGFQAGRAHRVRTERGTEVETQLAVAEAGDLIASHDTSFRVNPRFPSSLQPRARERVASQVQLQKFLDNLVPESLAPDPKAHRGAPIIGPDRAVEVGNLRTIGMTRAYETGHPAALAYKDFLVRNAERYGLDPEVITRMERPILVQVRRSKVDRVRFAQEANEGTGAAMSATEQARQDASRMSDRVLSLVEPSESGELLTAGNRDFFREFAREIVPPRELGRFVDAQGNVSAEGVARVRNALFARVFEDPIAVARLAESADVNIRNIQNGILQALPRLARVKQGIEAGTLHNLDLGPAITEAANALSGARATGLAPGMLLRQEGLFGGLSPAGRVVLQNFTEKARSAKAIGETLKNYADLVENQGAPAQAGLFGGRVASVEELFRAAAGGRQAGLFEGPLPPSGIPSSARRAGEAGGPAITEAMGAPPSVQPPGPQVSTTIPPSGRATTRATTPLTREGPVSTSGVGAIEPTSKRMVLQDTADVNALLRRATEAQPDFEASLQGVAETVPGGRLVRTRVKKAAETTQKLQHISPETNGDYLGGRLTFEGRGDVNQMIAGLRQRFEVLQVDDFLENPESRGGYRAVHVQVRLPSGLSAEVQLVPREVAPVQDVLHKEVYEKWRRRDQSRFTAAERAEYEQDMARMRRDYDSAWATFQQRTGAGAAPSAAAEARGAPPGAQAAAAPPRAPPPSAPSGAAPPPPPEEARFLGSPLPGAKRTPFSRPADQVGGSIQQSLDQLDDLSRRARIALEQEPEIARRGTLAPEARVPFREGGPKPETLTTRISEQDVRQMTATLVKTARDWKSLRQQVLDFGDTLTVNTAEAADRLLENVVQEWTRLRFAAGRTVKAFDIPPDLRASLEEAGVLVGRLRAGQVRPPIYTNIVAKLRRIKDLGPGEWRELSRDLVDAWRLNLFSVTSWTLDLVGNLSEVSAQLAGGAARDFYLVGKGQVNFPSLQGWVRAVRERSRLRGRPLPEALESQLGRTVSGERVGGTFRGALTGAEPGTFTTRTGPASKALDFVVGSPLYAKGAFDTAAKRVAATATVWRDAIEEANRLRLRGLARRQFYERFMRALPDEVIERAAAAGKKAGFNRDLSRWEERLAGSTTFRLLGDVFGRWPFQFTRTMGEWLGANPEVFRRLRNGTIRGEEIAEYLGKTATGWGGLWLIEEGVYDRVDFNSMEYVHENGERTRLAGRDPIPTALWLLATVKRDQDRSTAALRHASIPFARLLVGEGGLLGSIVSQFVRASRNRPLDARSLHRDMTDMVNRAIPGQALLSALKTVFDATLREGVGAQLPGVSLALPARVDPTTGAPLQPRQRIPGIPADIPAIGGTPIPGARRVTDPVFNLLSRYGLLVYRGPKSPIAGLPPAEVPEEWRREWEAAFAQHRQRLLRPLSDRMDQLARSDPERVREMIQARDAAAARRATQEVSGRHGGRRPVARQPTARERRGPAAFEEAEAQ